MSKVLVTGAAGFIGLHVARRFLEKGIHVVGLDSLNEYYDVNLKQARLAQLQGESNFEFLKIDLTDRSAIRRVFQEHSFDRVIHLAAQAGVRYSLEHPEAYVDSNLNGTLSILEGCRHSQVKHLVYASSSSVYGSNSSQPFSVSDPADHPLSLYAATKKSNELMAHSYSHLFQLPTTGLRFFTVYGPWGRPDMALFKFTKSILEGTPIDVYNSGRMKRDFTYVDDIAESIVRVTQCIPMPNPDWNSQQPDPSTSSAPYQVFNIGNQQPTELLYFIRVLENTLGIPAKLNMMPIQPGDVLETNADVSSLVEKIGFSPSTSIEDGIKYFVDWYRRYYGIR
jgi:UDP-glucuronate 4-epimerase